MHVTAACGRLATTDWRRLHLSYCLQANSLCTSAGTACMAVHGLCMVCPCKSWDRAASQQWDLCRRCTRRDEDAGPAARSAQGSTAGGQHRACAAAAAPGLLCMAGCSSACPHSGCSGKPSSCPTSRPCMVQELTTAVPWWPWADDLPHGLHACLRWRPAWACD